MGVAFFDEQQKRMKLCRTICLYKKEPFYVVAEGAPANLVHLYELGGGFRKPVGAVDYRDPDFDYRAFNLGYTNFQGRAFYISRLPDRQNSQGLSANCIGYRPYDSHFSSTGWMQSKDAYNTIKGIYPSLLECLSTVSPYAGGVESMAFSRLFAVKRSGAINFLSYRGRDVGYFDGGRVTFYKNKDADLIKKAAERVGVRCS